MKKIVAITVARSDFGILKPVLRAIDSHPELGLRIFAGGMHLSPEFGNTIKEVEQSGLEVSERIQMALSSDAPEAIAKTIGLGTISFAQAFEKHDPDLILVLGDRFEILAAVSAALPFAIPIAHIHGGEATEGLIDESIRHSITKMSHLHFPSAEAYRKRIIQMGEEPWRVTNCGAPALDNLKDISWISREELEQRIGLSLQTPPLIATLHPLTLEFERTLEHVSCFLNALESYDGPIVITYPNADTNGHVIIEETNKFVARHKNAKAVANLGIQAYYSLLKISNAMVGNSSSGIIEAASFQLPVVNIGKRQQGRISGENVIHVPYDSNAISEAVEKATSTDFKDRIKDIKNPYGDGNASGKIAEALAASPEKSKLIIKNFNDLES